MINPEKYFYAVQPEYAGGWWVVSSDPFGARTIDESNDGGFTEEMAKRVAACLNYCSDISTEKLYDRDEMYAQLEKQCEVLLERVQAVEKDAERYRYLRNHAHPDSISGLFVASNELSICGNWYTRFYSGQILDDEIDAARGG